MVAWKAHLVFRRYHELGPAEDRYRDGCIACETVCRANDDILFFLYEYHYVRKIKTVWYS